MFKNVKSAFYRMNISQGIIGVLGIFLVFRVVISVWAIFILRTFPIEIDSSAPTFDFYSHVVADSYAENSWFEENILRPWYRWDASWYLRIAVNGYEKGGSIAFAPLYPLLIRGLGRLLGNRFLLAAILISNTAAIFCCILFYSEVEKIRGGKSATRSVLYFLSFSTAFFLLGAYSESLFILFILLVWKYVRDGHWFRILLFSALATLTRFQGVGLLLPLSYIWWKRERHNRVLIIPILSLPIILLLWGAFLKYVLFLGYPWDMLGEVWKQHTGWPWTGIVTNITVIFSSRSLVSLSLILNTLSAGVFIVLLVWVYRRLPTEYALWMFALFLPALIKIDDSNQLVSVSRYVLSLLPGFIALGIMGENVIFHRVWIVFSFLSQAVASAAFFLWVWVA